VSVSLFGSGFRPGKNPSGWLLSVTTLQPIALNRYGVVSDAAPHPQSTTTRILFSILTLARICDMWFETAFPSVLIGCIRSHDANLISASPDSPINHSIVFCCFESNAIPSGLNSFTPMYSGGL
jgi:hypothetical protein